MLLESESPLAALWVALRLWGRNLENGRSKKCIISSLDATKECDRDPIN